MSTAKNYRDLARGLEAGSGRGDDIVSSRALLVDLHRKVADLLDERDQALIRAEMAEAELDAYRRADRVQERRAS